MTSPKKIRLFTKEDMKKMKCPFPPEPGYD